MTLGTIDGNNRQLELQSKCIWECSRFSLRHGKDIGRPDLDSSILFPPLCTRRTLVRVSDWHLKHKAPLLGRAYLIESSHRFVSTSYLDLVEKGLWSIAAFAGALRCRNCMSASPMHSTHSRWWNPSRSDTREYFSPAVNSKFRAYHPSYPRLPKHPSLPLHLPPLSSSSLFFQSIVDRWGTGKGKSDTRGGSGLLGNRRFQRCGKWSCCCCSRDRLGRLACTMGMLGLLDLQRSIVSSKDKIWEHALVQ